MLSSNEGSDTVFNNKTDSGNEWRVSDRGYYRLYDYWLSLCGLYELYDYALKLFGDIKGKRILDCGCGHGHTSVMFAKRGAHVTGFDISADNLKLGKTLAQANGVKIGFVSSLFEKQSFQDQSFDLLFGSCILHHVDKEKAALEMSRILRPGGKGVFIENSNRNPVLMAARNYLCGSFGIAKYGDDDEEHPLTHQEIQTLKDNFDGHVQLHFPNLVFFRLSDFYIFLKRSPLMTKFLYILDQWIGDRIPFLNRYSYFQIVQFEKC